MRTSLFELQIDEHLSLVIPDESCASEIYYLIDNDRDHLRPWLPWVDSTQSIDDTRKNIADRIKTFNEKKQASFYGTLDGEFVASVGFVSLKDSVGEIGYWLLSGYQGQGLMTIFVKACIEYGFDQLGLDTIIIKCAEGNSKSAGIPVRLGFTQAETTETTRVSSGVEHHTLIFRLERTEWKK